MKLFWIILLLNSTFFFAKENSTKFNKCFFTESHYINASDFGVIADFDGVTGTDNTEALQRAIDYASHNNKVIILPSGKILLNSYGKTDSDKAHGNILQLKSNISIKGNDSEIVVGTFFDDRGFVVFSAFNSRWVENFSTLNNITLENFTINFLGEKSYMKTTYSLRKGIEFGHSTNVVVENLTLKNGDLTCAIATGYGNKDVSENITIKNSKFLNLVKTQQNIDHSTLYINSRKGIIYNNIFTSTNIRSRLMACAIEIHNSDNIVENNVIEGYTRMMYVAAIDTENKHLHTISVKRNKANITNAAVYLWLDKDTTIEKISIVDNDIVNTHVDGYSMLYNGMQGIISDARDELNTSVKNMLIKNNKVHITNTLFKGRAVKFSTKYKFQNKNNQCVGCVDKEL